MVSTAVNRLSSCSPGTYSEEEGADDHQVIVPGSVLVPVRDTAKGRAQLYENPAAFHLNWGWGADLKYED